MSKFNYILNDLAFDTLVLKCLYGEPTDEDVKECENQIKLLQQENQQLKDKLKGVQEERDYLFNKQSIENKYLALENQQLKEKVGELTQSLNEQMKETNKENLDCSKYAIENQQLKEKINTYENPEDLTLMFMYCDEKAKDKIKQLKEVIEEVRKSIKDFQEYIDEAKDFYGDLDDNDVVKVSNLQILNNQMVRNYDLLQILDKVKDSDVK